MTWRFALEWFEQMLMRHRLLIAIGVVLLSFHAQALLGGAEQALPVRDGRPVVATVNGEPIFLDEMVLQLESPADTGRLLQGRATPTELGLLDRLVTVRLIAQEAATMGLADLPEIGKQVEVSSRSILREVLIERLLKDVKPDEAAVEKQYKDLVRESRTTSLLFADEAAAKAVREEVAAGGEWAAVAARAVADRGAKSEANDEYHQRKDYLPQIAEAVAKLEVGQVSPVLHIQAGYVIVKLADLRYPENAEARAAARSMALDEQRRTVLLAHEEALRAKHVVVKQDVLDSVDYEAAEPGIDALLKDTRVIAEIEGAPPVTVGDLTDYLRMQSFHGADQVAQGKRLNARKAAALDATIGRRVLNAEAIRLGIDKTDAYLDRLNAYEESLIFNSFVQKVIAPDSKMKEEEVRRYYDQHLGEYSSPEMLKVRSLAFTARGAAEEAVRKLRDGADYGWLATTAEGQVDKGTQGLVALDGRPVTIDSMPAGMQQALAGAKAGDFRLYASPEGHFYALAVQEVIAPSAKPYDEVREAIAKKLYAAGLKQGVEDYAAKLRTLSKVEIHLASAK